MITTMPSPEQQQIVDSVVDLLAARCPVERLRDAKAPPGAAEMAGWHLLAEMGVFGVGLAEEHGGVGYSVLEELLMFREMGRQVVSPTVLGSCLGAHLAAALGRSDLSRAIASGKRKVALAVPTGTGGHGLSADAVQGDFYVVDRMDAADAIVWSQDGMALLPLDGADLAPVERIDTSVTLERLAAGSAPAGFVPDADRVLRHRALLLTIAVLVGMAEAACHLAVEYAKVREQFGKPIGSFQAVAHHCANMAARAEAAWVQTKFAALAYHGSRGDTPFQVSAAYLLAQEAASMNSAISVRVHGGMGFTAETSVHHYVKRTVLMKSAGGAAVLHGETLLAEPAAAV